eukprot:CAMPEP_0173389872 /NCGR_PEP_ID=MMETSP1356-20130122/13787_1 /TAXON_ID=77927 ORGANISM="Hemiselmis virescens, Strain PCC157" /NCGR_SAMPLE_ID=MMETSP1356 /ASSEMBLY_ACC=CAM_ASM_000847 /LENGTH=109 /DNA_ID=CAMNT_0014347143 /DNA_START=253 /DNA_END=582 /DNA_ORIENTATION=+
MRTIALMVMVMVLAVVVGAKDMGRVVPKMTRIDIDVDIDSHHYSADLRRVGGRYTLPSRIKQLLEHRPHPRFGLRVGNRVAFAPSPSVERKATGQGPPAGSGRDSQSQQ